MFRKFRAISGRASCIPQSLNQEEMPPCQVCRVEGCHLRCTKCKTSYYCSRDCQAKDWNVHKLICSTDPAKRGTVSVELAIERALAKQPPMEEAPKDACCYICLEGDGEEKLMRGCACRGDSAGFVHLKCFNEVCGE